MTQLTTAVVLLVTASLASFRRAGLGFTNKGTALHIDSLTDEQRAAIDAEPKLSVKEVSADAIPEGVDRTPFDTFLAAQSQTEEKEKTPPVTKTKSANTTAKA
ncbi:HI1506-related protein [Alteromonas confluentis]|uniref:Mu-like prophage FluMu N-terminal domain-containing protein n=1 Tax=Alteromonas confluentis TaxID=1656094 RepID=A0A1E7ZED3_9ALTE|nr:HI1506-related protein [Alteromonas confluentis]OFC71812.1 hypothetical protein BFC18_06565 [Alteromonas confluentis]